jgi:hypothetical protein
MLLTYIKLKTTAAINKTLTSYNDPDQGQIFFSGCGIQYFKDDFKSAPRTLPILSFSRLDDLFELVVNVAHEGFSYPIHFSWIDSFITTDGTALKLHTSKYSNTTQVIAFKGSPLAYEIDTDSFIEIPTCINCGAQLTPSDDHYCESCVHELTATKSYSYKPTPSFIGESTYFYGIELEYGFNKRSELAKFMHSHKGLVYLKEDSSIRGGEFRAELVSHPFSFDALMSPDSFIHQVDKLSVTPHENNGCHVHISRTAFNDNKHYSLFYFLLYSSQKLLETVGGRELNSYCQYLPTGHVSSKSNTPLNSGTRASVINENNRDTIEVRIFNSTNSTEELKRYIQFLDSLINYTASVSKQATLSGWAKFIAKNSSKYSVIHTFLADYTTLLTGKVIYKDPILKTMPISKLPLTALNKITKIFTENDTIIVTPGEIITNNGTIRVQTAEGGTNIQISSITQVEIQI